MNKVLKLRQQAAAILVICILLLTGCGAAAADSAGTESAGTSSAGGAADRISIVTTIFPVYDWTRAIAGDTVPADDIVFLTAQGVDMHSYLPSTKDMAAILAADLVIYIGGESDSWLTEALAANPDPERKELPLLDVIGSRAVEEEIKEGMEAEPSEGEDTEGPETDEHIWLSLRNAQLCCEAIADALAELLPGARDTIMAGLSAYEAELGALDAAYEKELSEAERSTLLFGDRFPFRYLTEDYGLDYYAAFSGCYADAEAGFSTVTFLAAKLDELSLPCVLVIDGSDRKLAQTIIDNSADPDRKILALDSMQSVTEERVRAGLTYTGAMEGNLDVLCEALGAARETGD